MSGRTTSESTASGSNAATRRSARGAVGGGRHLEPERLESLAQDLAHGFLVVHDEDLEWDGHEPPAVIDLAPGIRRA